MRSLLLLLCLATIPAGATAPGEPTKTSLSASRFVIDSGVEAAGNDGLVVRADLRDEYLAGFPILVELTARNDGTTTLSTPDLAARRHLVRFRVVSPDGKTLERSTTAPAFDTAANWALAPRTKRSVLFEVPSSSAFVAGNYQLTLIVGSGDSALTLPTQKFQLSAAKPLSAPFPFEATTTRTLGASLVWTQPLKVGFDVYLDQYQPGTANRLSTRHRLLRVANSISPLLSRASSAGSRSRHVYWSSGQNEIRLAKLEGTRIDGPPSLYAAPWPNVEPIARGITDGKGGFMLPLWVPAPQGGAGAVKVLCADVRGGVVFRVVADFPARPTAAESAVDAAGNLLLSLAHPKGFDLYRVDAAWPPELPAAGKRIWKADSSWTTIATAFDVLPDSAERPGGLVVTGLQTSTGGEPAATQVRTLIGELSGKLRSTGQAAIWTAPTVVESLLPTGGGLPHILSRDAGGSTWYSRPELTPINLGKLPKASLWLDDAGTVSARWVAGPTVVTSKIITTQAAAP